MANLAMLSGKIEKAASGGLRFLFAPQLKVGLKPSGAVLAGFVQMIAQFLAGARLIPSTHRALRPLSPADARLGEVLALAYANVRKPGTKLDQVAVFGAVSALMALIVVTLVHMAGQLLVGAAHASSLTLLVAGVVCALSGGGGGTSYFEAPCASDMAQQWIDMLLFGQTNWFSTQIQSVPLRLGMEAMFQTYSYAMLIVAGFLVLYHILAIVAGTAHDGRFGGRQMNQVWAPIRLVMAIGLLVPVGMNGLNSGQIIVAYVAKWGSALASNIWMNFAVTYASQTGIFIIAPPLPQVSPTLKEALKILTCTAGYNIQGDYLGGKFSVVPHGWYITSQSTARTTWDWVNGDDPTDIEPVACGSVEMSNPDYTATGSAFEFLGTDSMLSASESARQTLLEAHQTALETLMDSSGTSTPPTCDGSGNSTGGSTAGGLLYQLATKIYWSADAGNTCYRLTEDDLEMFNDAVADYRAEITGAVTISLTSMNTIDMALDAYVRGWLSAGVWFNTIARSNGLMIDFTQEMPVAKPNFKTLVEQKYANTIMTAMDSVDASIANLPVLASTGTTFTLAEPNYLVSYGGSSGGGSMLDIYLKTLAANFAFVLGDFSDSPDEVTSTFGFSLNSANPLAELSTLGYRIIELAMKVSRSLNECINQVQNEQRAIKENPSVANSFGSLTSCGGSSFVGQVPTEAFLMHAAMAAMVSGGVTLAFMLPLLPFLRFMFGILTWVLSLYETVIAIPIVALAHIKMDGDGVSGPLARTAYLLLLQLFVRPTLMIFGLVLSLIVFNVMVLALNEFYTMAVRGVEDSGRLGAISAIVYTVIYASTAYALANASFKAIDLVPDRVLQWIGANGIQTIDETQRVAGAVSQTAGVGGSALGTSANRIYGINSGVNHSQLAMSTGKPV